MNIKYHITCGIVLDVIYQTKGIMTLCSILPDSPLIVNELRLIKNNERFDPYKVPDIIFNLYKTTHSLLFLPFVYYFTPCGFIAWLVHQIADWFTHTGRFSSIPLYPIPYTVKFGKEILK